MKFYLLCLSIIISNAFRYKNSKSLFESITPNDNINTFTENNINNNNNEYHINSNTDKSLQALLDKLKKEIKTPYLKDNITPENVANYFGTTLSGNQVLNNLEVYDQTHLTNTEIKDNLTVHGESNFNSITTNKFISNPIIIDDNDIIINKDTLIKIGNNTQYNMTYTIKDIFEAITFVKYIVNICGEKLNKCDFTKLIINQRDNDIKRSNLRMNVPQFKEINYGDKYIRQLNERDDGDVKMTIDKEYEIYKKEMMLQKKNENNRNENIMNNKENYYNEDKIQNLDTYYNDILNRYYYLNQGGVYNVN